MVPGSGPESNRERQLLAEWKDNNKGGAETPEAAFAPDIEKLFETLAEWNDYLENHVPYFQKPQEPEL